MAHCARRESHCASRILFRHSRRLGESRELLRCTQWTAVWAVHGGNRKELCRRRLAARRRQHSRGNKPVVDDDRAAVPNPADCCAADGSTANGAAVCAASALWPGSAVRSGCSGRPDCAAQFALGHRSSSLLHVDFRVHLGDLFRRGSLARLTRAATRLGDLFSGWALQAADFVMNIQVVMAGGQASPQNWRDPRTGRRRLLLLGRLWHQEIDETYYNSVEPIQLQLSGV